MNLIHIILRPIITLTIIILIPKHNKRTLEKIRKLSASLIFIQTIHLHTHCTHNIKQIILLFTSNRIINNTTIKFEQLCIDTLSTTLMILTNLLIITCILIRKKTIYHTHKTLYICLFRIMLTLFLTFTTSRLLIFYIMFESSIIPLIFIIGIWGSRKEKTRATYYFLLYTIIGSLPLFITILIIQHQLRTFNISLLQNIEINTKRQLKLFTGLFLAFAIKTPLIPWHRWLPLAHVEAPAIGSVLLAGILLKLGTYGFIRFTIPILTQSSKFLSPIIITIRIISMWLARINRLRQNDIKRIIAYSSIAHMGMITAACFSLNTIRKTGAILLMLRHGLTSSALFALMSHIYERHKSRLIKNFQGISYTTPILSTLIIITTLSHMRTPGSINFLGEYLCLLGLWELHPSITIIRTIGIIIGTTYLLLLYIQITRRKRNIYTKYNIQDLSLNERQSIIILLIPNITIGIIPYPILKWIITIYNLILIKLLIIQLLIISIQLKNLI
uniref:NADH dehydrogenase subunit 4 n=1 Tax=Caulophacus iocasicus TaxID=3031190 RepID=UPI0023F085E2|nr:NADH dehydrogenase subunit 4 [Caulophacus iocasicus]WDY83520.1 NADH dehydrogenase subunit 4 [Caulophacus iocasicus]